MKISVSRLMMLPLLTISGADIDLEITGSADLHDFVWGSLSVYVTSIDGPDDNDVIGRGDNKGASTGLSKDRPGCTVIKVRVNLPTIQHKVVEPHQLKELTQYSLGALWILLGLAHGNERVRDHIRDIRSRCGCHVGSIFPFYALKLFNSPLYLEDHFTATAIFYGEPFARTFGLANDSGAFKAEVGAIRRPSIFSSVPSHI